MKYLAAAILLTAVVGTVTFAAPPAPKATGKSAVTYERDIAPLWEKSCVGCHNKQSPSSGYDMSSPEAMLRGGNRGRAIVPGSAKRSILYQYLVGQIKPVMPLGGSLKPAEIEAVRRWIDAGAKTAAVAAAAAPKAYGAVLPSVAPPVTSLTFAPDGRTLAVGAYQEVQLWDVATGKRTGIVKGAAEAVHAIAFSPDGKTLAVGGGTPTLQGEILLFDAQTGGLRRRFGREHTDLIYSLAFTPDGAQLVSASGDRTLRLWDTATGAPLKLMKDHADGVYGMTLSPDGGRIVSTGVDRSIKVWERATGRSLFTFTGRAHNDTAYTLQFSPDGKRLLSSGGDNLAKLWTVGEDADTTTEFRRLTGHERAVHAAAFSPDGMLIATASADKKVNLYSGVGGGWLRTLTGPGDWVYKVAFTPDSQHVVAGTYDGGLYLWRASDGALAGRFSTRPDAVTIAAEQEPKKEEKKRYEPVKIADGLSFPEGPAYDGKGALFVSNCNADNVDKINKEGKALAFQAAKDKYTFEKTNGMAFFEDGSLFACDQSRKAIIRIFMDGRMENFADKWEDTGFRGPNDLAFDPDGSLYFTDPAGSDAKNPVGAVYRVAKGTRKVTRVADGMGFPNGIAFSADGKTVYIAESSFFRIMRAQVNPDGTLGKPELFHQMPPDNTPDGIAFDQAGNLYVANYEPGEVIVLDKTGARVRTIKLPGDACTNVDFGGKDMKTLYVTLANDKKPAPGGEVYAVEVEVGGLPLFRAPNNEVK